MTKLHLDVDGVINARMAYRVWDTDPDDGVGLANSGGRDWTIRWSPAMVKRLAALDTELMWTTTWLDDAPTNIAGLIGFGEAGGVVYPTKGSFNPYRDASIVWKRAAVRALYGSEDNLDRFVWLDDEITPDDELWALSVGGLAIGIDPNVGITPTDMERIEEYVNA